MFCIFCYTEAEAMGRFHYTQAVLKFLKLDTQAQQRETVVQGRILSPYRLRYIEQVSSATSEILK
ncbi:MAG: hypothetical protein LBJ00_05825 [Planctomycetaceae bacterium]|nr:hypothetical protein [Planctomycetaceae bacterium]